MHTPINPQIAATNHIKYWFKWEEAMEMPVPQSYHRENDQNVPTGTLSTNVPTGT
jgi:hypothetical protein